MRESYAPLLEVAVRHGFKELAFGVSLPETLAEVALVGYLSGAGMPPEQALRKLESRESELLGGREAHEVKGTGGGRLVGAPMYEHKGPWMGGPGAPGMAPGGYPVAPAGFPFGPGAVSPLAYPAGPVGVAPCLLPPMAAGAPGPWDGFRPMDP